MLAERVQAALGQTWWLRTGRAAVVVVGATETVRATPDGYSLGHGHGVHHGGQPGHQPQDPYNPLTDFTPIINMAATPNVIGWYPSVPGARLRGLRRRAQEEPRQVQLFELGHGGIGHLQMELLQEPDGHLRVAHPTAARGPGAERHRGRPGPMIFDNLPSGVAFIRMAVWCPSSWPRRSAWRLPNVPTFEVGLEPVNRMAFYGVLGPGPSKEAVDKVHSAAPDPARRR